MVIPTLWWNQGQKRSNDPHEVAYIASSRRGQIWATCHSKSGPQPTEPMFGGSLLETQSLGPQSDPMNQNLLFDEMPGGLCAQCRGRSCPKSRTPEATLWAPPHWAPSPTHSSRSQVPQSFLLPRYTVLSAHHVWDVTLGLETQIMWKKSLWPRIHFLQSEATAENPLSCEKVITLESIMTFYLETLLSNLV